MASPPFSIAETTPADDAVAAGFPLTERTFRDVVESWFLIDGNTSGRKNKVSFDYHARPTGVASVTQIWADTSGNMKQQTGASGNEQFLGLPPGVILPYGGNTAPDGYLACYGQAVSRTTYADLFTAIGVIHGVGDNSTTFNLPDLRGRVVAGQDDMGGSSANRLTGITGGIDGDVMGTTGGEEAHTLLTAGMPVHSHTATVTETAHKHAAPSGSFAVTGTGGLAAPGSGSVTTAGVDPGNTATALTGITVANSNTGSGSAHNNVQPTIILNYIIKV